MNIIPAIYYHFFCLHIVKKNLFQRERYNDRNVLEQIIFPHVLAKFRPRKILDIGREDYQAFYNDFFSGRELWTMDIDPEREEFGSPGKHITDNATNVKNHFQEGYFDFILINGVLGWGLNNRREVERAFKGIVKILKKSGILIIGWNDFKDIKTIKPKEINALKSLKPCYFKPLKTDEFRCTNGEHVYTFFTK